MDDPSEWQRYKRYDKLVLLVFPELICASEVVVKPNSADN